MFIILLLSCLTIIGSAVPVLPSDPPLEVSQGGPTEAQTAQPLKVTNQKPDASQTPAPQVEQPPPGISQQPGFQAQGGVQFLPPAQFYTWYPLGGSPMFIPLQPSIGGSTMNQPSVPQQPLLFSPYSYFPFFSSPYMNQMFSPHGWNMPPQNLANQPQNSPALPAETPAAAAAVQPVGNAPQPVQQQQQQQQNSQVVYMLQQSMNLPVGSLSSEELEMAANTGQLGVYLTSVLTSPPAGAVQPVNQAAGLKNPEQQSLVPTVGTSSAGAAVTQSLQPHAEVIPAGLEGPTKSAGTVQTPVQAEVQPTQANPV
ncbi:DNA translocase FtsK-like [Xyrichtys novacula]|uniref:DNA translocase FtsK-like n=1 Tax=Xyrichtys novacula TaxID=13765 RepID=A0AAV1EUU6_XYRNO|nr:DNA translocase FtsK-like [Xyrichtys novacula]